MSACLLTYPADRLDVTADGCYCGTAIRNAPLAQLVEQLTLNPVALHVQTPTFTGPEDQLTVYITPFNERSQNVLQIAIMDSDPFFLYNTRRTQSNGGLGVRPLPLPAPSQLTTNMRRMAELCFSRKHIRADATNPRRPMSRPYRRLAPGAVLDTNQTKMVEQVAYYEVEKDVSAIAGSNPAPSLQIKNYRLWNLDIPRRPPRVGVIPSSQSTLTIPPLPRNKGGSVGVRSQGGLYTEDSRWFLKTWHCALLLQCGQGGERLIVPSPSCLKNLTREAV